MNIMNGIIGLTIADSRAKHYNTKNPQSIKTIGLMVGMMIKNPIMSYLLIENMAKNPDNSIDLLRGLTENITIFSNKINNNLTDLSKTTTKIEASVKDLPNITNELKNQISPLLPFMEEIKGTANNIYSVVNNLQEYQKTEPNKNIVPFLDSLDKSIKNSFEQINLRINKLEDSLKKIENAKSK